MADMSTITITQCRTCGDDLKDGNFRPGRRRCKRCEWKAESGGTRRRLTCAICGTPFGRMASRIKPSELAFCSPACRGAGRRGHKGAPAHNRGVPIPLEQRRRQSAAMRGRPSPRRGIPISEEQKRKQSAAMKGRPSPLKGRTIPVPQRAKQSATMKARPVGTRTKPSVIVACWHCNGAIDVPGNRSSVSQRPRFCSKRHWYAYIREHPAEHPQFRGGPAGPYGPEWTQEAETARIRDKDTCQDCGQHQAKPRLDVHHVTPLRSFGGDYGAANRLDNLISLCKRCHKIRECAITFGA